MNSRALPVLSGALLLLGATAGCDWGADVPLGGITPEQTGGTGNPPPLFEFEAIEAVSELNSDVGDANPTLSFDMLAICFTSLRTGGTGDEDVWCSQRADPEGAFDPPVEATSLNSPLFETSSALSPDGLQIWFGSRRAGGPGEVDVYKASRSAYDQPFTAPVLEDTLNSPYDDIPRPLGFGGRFMPLGSRRMNDAYLTYLAEYRSASDDFDSPELIDELADSDRTTVDAFLLEDGLTLFFIQDDPDLGTGDIYFVKRPTTSEPFGVPEPVAGVNTEFHERDPWLSPDESTLYFSSDRDGNTDIFRATRTVR